MPVGPEGTVLEKSNNRAPTLGAAEPIRQRLLASRVRKGIV
ncbi:hypothetical protein NY78_4394 [Desulfovibrio sp. TomC]|nr:hypothetical protein NY78_4394 [Desulfovibrio sp. TomC]